MNREPAADRIVAEALRIEPSFELPPAFADSVVRRAMPAPESDPISAVEIGLAAAACLGGIAVFANPVVVNALRSVAAAGWVRLDLVAATAAAAIFVALLDRAARPRALRGVG